MVVDDECVCVCIGLYYLSVFDSHAQDDFNLPIVISGVFLGKLCYVV